MEIQRRQLDFEFDPATVPLDWCHTDPYGTTFLNALSLLFPEGERFFVDSVKQARDRVTSPELQRQITGFIGQEAMHGKEHRAFNEMLAVHGFEVAPKIEARLRWFLRVVRRVLSPKSQLAVTCALEHFTALLAESMLTTDAIREEIHPSVRPLWVWHCFEETEHKAVAFDVYRATGGGYVRRIGIMMLTSFFFFVIVGGTHARLLASRGILWKPWRWLRGIKHMWIWPGHFTGLVPAYFSYYRPRFHPDDRDTRELLARWRERLFGEHGELRLAA
jgi:predicted metal-dependent hydrolase